MGQKVPTLNEIESQNFLDILKWKVSKNEEIGMLGGFIM